MAETQCHASTSRPEENGESSSSAAAAQNTAQEEQSTSTEEQQQQQQQQQKTAEPPHCANCKKPEEDPETKPLKPCLKCHSILYCSRDCLKADFKTHKKVCPKLSQEYAKTADFKMASRSSGGGKKDGFRGGLQKWQFDT